MRLEFVATVAEDPNTDATGQPVFAGLSAPSPTTIVDREQCEHRDFDGSAGKAIVVSGDGRSFRVLVGLGNPTRVSGEVLRRGAGVFAREVDGCARVSFDARGVARVGLTAGESAQAVAEGIALASHRFLGYKSAAKSSRLEQVNVVVDPSDRLSSAAGLARGAIVADAVNLARDFANEPGGVMTPKRLAEIAVEIAEDAALHVQVFDEEDIASQRLGGLLGVSRGSHEPPRLVRLAYVPEGAEPNDGIPTVALVGKGITFDSGGLSLKTADGMMAMKTDMSGAAAVIAVLGSCRALKIPVRVIGILPMAENMPGGRAVKPGDVVRIRNGKTIEVLNTDAEGRLILADGLSLAVEEAPDAIIDLATLTKACVVALGHDIAGLMGNSEALVLQVQQASTRAGEGTWHLPLPEDYKSHIESNVADMKNTGVPGQAGALTAGLLLSEFVGDTPWAHLDIVGRCEAEVDYRHKGASGFGVRTLVELLSRFAPVEARIVT